MQQTTQIFNEQYALKQRIKAIASDNYPDFLEKLVAEELVFRLSLIDKQFSNCVIGGSFSDSFEQILKQSERIKSINASRFDLSDFCFADESLDCFIAGPGLEMINDLPGTFANIRKCLKPDGLFLGFMAAGSSLSELRQCWLEAESAILGGASPHIAPFCDVRQAGDLLQAAGLALPVADTDRFTIRYDDAMALMRELKAMGTSNCLNARSRGLTSPSILAEVARIYAEKFSDPDGRIRASGEIIYLTAWAPDASQQQPLAPGSAQISLTEILK